MTIFNKERVLVKDFQGDYQVYDKYISAAGMPYIKTYGDGVAKLLEDGTVEGKSYLKSWEPW